MKTIVRDHHIDRLRALCIFLVLNLHFGFSEWHYPHFFSNNIFRGNGFYGVVMFFVISGYLITTMSIKRWGDLGAISLNEFYVMRATRILPALACLIVVLLTLHFAGVPGFVVPPGIDILNSLWFVFTFRYNYLLGSNNVYGMLPWAVLWSLSVEEAFYLFFPVICLALRKRGLIISLLAVFIISAPYSRVLYGNFCLSGVVDSISFGCLAALVVDYLKGREVPLWVAPVLRVLGMILFIWVGTTPWVRNNLIAAPTPISIGVALFLIGSGLSKIEAPLVRRIFAPIEAIGRRSYEIYLLHLPVLFVLMNILGPSTSRVAGDNRFFLFMFIAWILGELTGRYFTEPTGKYLRRQLSVFFSPERHPGGQTITGNSVRNSSTLGCVLVPASTFASSP